MKAKNKVVQVEIALGDGTSSATADDIKNRLAQKAVHLAKPVNGGVRSRIREGSLLQVEIVLGPKIDEPTVDGIKAQLKREATQLAETVHGVVRSQITEEPA